jgi:hypothetical protein
MTKKLTNPCYKCVCIPICKHKKFHKLVGDCVLLHNYLVEPSNETNYHNVMIVLKPTTWRVTSGGDPTNAILCQERITLF